MFLNMTGFSMDLFNDALVRQYSDKFLNIPRLLNMPQFQCTIFFYPRVTEGCEYGLIISDYA